MLGAGVRVETQKTYGIAYVQTITNVKSPCRKAIPGMPVEVKQAHELPLVVVVLFVSPLLVLR
jgi:hypothetical protein